MVQEIYGGQGEIAKRSKLSERESPVGKGSLCPERGRRALPSRGETQWKWCFKTVNLVAGRRSDKPTSCQETIQEGGDWL